jgi:DNA mismatch endonuclease (patch repair protein)
MASVKSSGNRSTEVRLAKILRTHGLVGWRRHQRLPGNPDFVYRRERVVIFVDGCFWHGCPKCYSPPVANAEFWKQKLAYNRARDRRLRRELRALGWRVLCVWEHSLRDETSLAKRIGRALAGRSPSAPRLAHS